MSCLLFTRLPWPGGLSGLCCPFCYSFLTSCGVDESLDLHSLYLASFLGYVLLGHWYFLLQSNTYPFCGSANTFAMLPRCFCHVIIWLVLVGPLLGLLYTFLLLSSNSPVLSLGLYSRCFGLPWPISLFWGFLGPFYSFRHPRPVLFPRASPTHSNLSFLWAFAKSFGFSQPKLPYPLLSGFIGFPTNPICLVSSFGLLRPIFAYFPFLIMPMGLLLLSSGSFGPACFLWGHFTILQAYEPLFLPFRLNSFLLNLLIILLYSLPYWWVSSYYLASLSKWASTIYIYIYIYIYFFFNTKNIRGKNYF